MHRQDLLAKLERYHPTDAAEIESRGRIIEFVRSTPDCFRREHLAGHITGSAWLIDERQGRVLLTHHRKLDKWLQLGGHCDGESDVLGVALKEAVEESGIADISAVSPDIYDLDVHPIPQRGDTPHHFHYDIRFLCRINGDPDYVVSDESHELAWLTPEEILEMTVGQSILRMRDKWLRHMGRAH
ncbi:MAG: NUDIX hydrolase [Phycisphaerales bacterium]|nr:NUDIX hydrolase [Phycisphaerales bacterium]